MKTLNNKSDICKNIKLIIINSIETDELTNMTFSIYLSDTFDKKYVYLTKIFLKQYGFTIKHFTNDLKIERIKFLINQKVLNISEIADKMHYSSPSHLSHQFKTVTNQTPSEYKIFCIEG